MIELTIFEYVLNVLNDEDKKKMMDVSSFMIIFRKCQRHNDFPFCRGKGTDSSSILLRGCSQITSSYFGGF